jgi:hypothetical protein
MKRWVKILLAGAFVFAGVLAYVYFFIYNKPHTDYEKAKPHYVLTAEELYVSFAENQFEAESKYNGKVALITGSLSFYDEFEELVILNFSFAEGLFGAEGVRCTMLPKYVEQAKQLQEGSEVSLKGLVTGFSGSDVIMEHCSIQ